MDASGIARRPSAVTSNTVPETVELRGAVEDAGDATVGDVLPQATPNTDSERAVITPRHIRPPQKKAIDSIGSTRGSSAETGFGAADAQRVANRETVGMLRANKAGSVPNEYYALFYARTPTVPESGIVLRRP